MCCLRLVQFEAQDAVTSAAMTASQRARASLNPNSQAGVLRDHMHHMEFQGADAMVRACPAQLPPTPIRKLVDSTRVVAGISYSSVLPRWKWLRNSPLRPGPPSWTWSSALAKVTCVARSFVWVTRVEVDRVEMPACTHVF
jgi:hypothetical protein